jgi:MinD-like ATPase involved in chromosome partitioning or flagellar assembly/DNA-binding NarL/FixJ family response regulator
MKEVITAVNHPILNQYLKDNHLEFNVEYYDFQHQEKLFESLKRSIPDVLILNESLPGSLDKYALIEKIRQIDTSFRIIMIVSKKDKEFDSFLSAKGIFDILLNDQAEIIDLVDAIKRENKVKCNTKKEISKEARKEIKTLKKLLNEKPKIIEKQIIMESPPKIQRQQIIVAAGAGSVGKSDFTTQLSVTLARKSQAKILVIDLNTEFPSLDQFFDIPKEPPSVDYFIGNDKTSCLNYMIDNIDKGRLDSSIFDELVIKHKSLDNLHILTGNYSLYLCQNVLNSNYYKVILDKAKSMYDFIFIDTSSNIFLDATQFAATNASNIFFLVEGTYTNLRKSVQVLDLYVKTWDIPKDRIHIVVNKFSDHSLDKSVIKEILADYEYCKEIKYNSHHDLFLNKNIPLSLNASDKDLEPYLKILKGFNFIEKENLFKRLFSSNMCKKEEIEIKYYENNSTMR